MTVNQDKSGLRSSQRIPFSSLFSLKSRAEVIVTFLSILELTRLRYIHIFQPKPEEEIWVKKNFNRDEIDMKTIYSIEESYSKQTTQENSTQEQEEDQYDD